MHHSFVSPASIAAGKTKNDLINQAHEARQAREFARRREQAAATIQAFLKAVTVRQNYKRDVFNRFQEALRLSYAPDDTQAMRLIREVLFVCHPRHDRATLELLLSFLLASCRQPLAEPANEAVTTTCEVPATSQDDQPTTGSSKESPGVEFETVGKALPLGAEQSLREDGKAANGRTHKPVCRNLARVILAQAATCDEVLNSWAHVLGRLLDICLERIYDSNNLRLDSQLLDGYIRLVHLFISPAHIVEAAAAGDNKLHVVAAASICDRLFAEHLAKRKDFFKQLSTLVCRNINRFRNDLKASTLDKYTLIALRLAKIDASDETIARIEKLSPSARTQKLLILNELLSCHGFVIYLEKFAPSTLRELNSAALLLNYIRLSSSCRDGSDLQNLTSGTALNVLANIVHLMALNERVVADDVLAFASVINKLLHVCRQNKILPRHKQANLQQAVGARAPSAEPPSTNATDGCQPITTEATTKSQQIGSVCFNPILGWLQRELVGDIDKVLAKQQLAHLWSLKFLRIFFADFCKPQEQGPTPNANNDGKTNCKGNSTTDGLTNCRTPSQQQSPAHTGGRRNSFLARVAGSTKASYETSSPAANNNDSPLCVLRRAVERAVGKGIGSPLYAGKTGVLGGMSAASAKLMTPESNRIAQVCQMFNNALSTLTQLRQEILMGLCLHDFLLPNLWKFISALGPQNGLRAFLEHLAACSKTNAPEFHILILFCDCASHLISILDDSELYERQKPFSMDDLIAMSTFMNHFVFRTICNNLIPSCISNALEPTTASATRQLQQITNTTPKDPILLSTHKLLTDLYKRDCRRQFAPTDHWLIKDIKMSAFLRDLDAEKPTAYTILAMLPHVIPHKERVLIFRSFVARDKSHRSPNNISTLITVRRSRIVEDGYQQLSCLTPSALKGLIRVKFINDHGLDEAGIDQDGVFKEFLEDTIKRIFDPALNLFCTTSEQRLYPSPTSHLHENHLSLFHFVGVLIGKAIYERIVVDVPFANFFLSRILGQPQSPLYSPIDELPSLDPGLYKSLTYVKHYEGNVAELDLYFSVDQDFMGKLETYELEPGGKSIKVTNESRIRYIHAVANFHMKTQIEHQTEAFVSGFKSIINLEWLSIFSASEFQRLISGDNTPIDLQDLRKNTKYFGGFHNNHRVVCWFWDVLEKDFTTEEHRLFLKFVTSCSKPPLLGFANLEPSFTIRCVEVSDDEDLGDTMGSVLRGFFAIRRSDPVDRLPTSSTCFNMLKLPNYRRRSTLREKLRYAIRSNPGFELS